MVPGPILPLSLVLALSWAAPPHASDEDMAIAEAMYGNATKFHGFHDDDFGQNSHFGPAFRRDLTYGEVEPKSAVKLLKHLGVTPGQRFYDLGSGVGKIPAIAWLLFGLHATGIEYVEERHQIACSALSRLHTLENKSSMQSAGSMHLVHGSMFDFDLADADFIFMNSVVWDAQTLDRLAYSFKALRPRTKIVAYSFLGLSEGGDQSRFNPSLLDDFDFIDHIDISGSWNPKVPTGFEILEKISERQPEAQTTSSRTYDAQKICEGGDVPRGVYLRRIGEEL